jgi:hypothetical protein
MAAVTQRDNPIIWQELSHQQRNAPRFLQRWWILGPLLIFLMVVMVGSTLTQIDYPTRELGIYMIWVVQIATISRALVAGANTISREHVGLTWDALVLTGVSAQQILFGKWRAALRRVGPWMVMFGVIRLAMIPILFIALVNRCAAVLLQYASYGYDEPVEVSWVPWAAVLVVVMSVVMTILEVMCCTAIGLAASAVMRRGIAATLAALIVRFLPVALFAAFTRYELGAEASNSYRVLRFAPFAIADSGTAPLSRLAVPYTPLSMTTHADALYGLTLAVLVLIVLLAAALVVAWVAIRRSGALPHPRYRVAGNSFRNKVG